MNSQRGTRCVESTEKGLRRGRWRPGCSSKGTVSKKVTTLARALENEGELESGYSVGDVINGWYPLG